MWLLIRHFPDDSDVEHLYVCAGYLNTVGHFEVIKMFYILIDVQPFHNCVHLSKHVKLYSSKRVTDIYMVTCTSVYLEFQKNVILTNATTWLKFEGTISSEISQPQKTK